MINLLKTLFLTTVAVTSLFVETQALTLGDIRVAVRQHIDDRADPALRYSDSILNTVINEGQRDMVNRSWCLQKTSTQSLSVRTTYYSLPNDLIAVQEVNIKDTSTSRIRQLEEKSERGLYQENPDFERQAGAPVYYFVRHSTGSGTALEYGILPVPSTSGALGTVLIDYYSQPTDLSSASDVPLGGFRHLYPYHSALVYYTVARIKLLEKDFVAADSYMKLYEASMALMIDRLGRMPNFSPGFQAGSGQ